MAFNCSLIIPQIFQFNAVGCDSTQINNECPTSGQSRVIFDISMPEGANAATVRISLLNLRTNQSYRHIISISEYRCSCSTLCIEDTGYKKDNKHIITVTFNDLIPGDRYSGSACLEYIS